MPEKWRELAALRPIYGEQGNVCELWLKDGRVLVEERSIDSSVKALWRFYELDIRAQRLKVRGCLGRKTVLPFYLPDSRIFCPVKMRSARAPKDTVNGYVDFEEITAIVEHKDGLGLQMKSGLTLPLLASEETILLSREMGYKLRRFLGNKPVLLKPVERLRVQTQREVDLLVTVTEMIAEIYTRVCESPTEYGKS